MGIVWVPILHGSLPFALAVRQAFERERPDCVAVELPETLGQPVTRAVRRLPLLSVLRWETVPGRPSLLLVEPCDGVFEALRLARDRGLPAHLVDRDTDGYGAERDPVPDPHAAASVGHERYAELVAEALARTPPTREDELREATMAFHLSRLARHSGKVLFVCGLAHVVRVRALLEGAAARPLGRTKREGVEVFHLDEAASREVLSEPGYVQGLFEAWRDAPPAPDAGDRYVLSRNLILRARERMQVQDGERLGARELRIALQFARNQALVRSALAPDLYELTVAARSVASDDFAWHVWDLGVTYPHQTDRPDLPTYRLTLEELDRSSKRVWFRRSKKTRRHVLRLVRSRPKEPAPGAWGQRLREPLLCSYPPEDVRIEAYGAELRKRAKSLLAAEHAKVAPFLSGFGDGIDLRETIKNLCLDGRIFVREERVAPSEIGAVCFVFDPDDRDGRYGWTMTWQGEHEEESDMALYATPPHENLVGPKIGRSEYGGFLMTYPPGRMFQVFEDPYFENAQTKSERLLYAAIDYATSRSILYVAPRPPRPKLTTLARRANKKIIYLPIGQLSPAKIRKIRVFHVLEGRRVRAYAPEYVGD